MPTPDGSKSVHDSIEIGMPYVLNSGVMSAMYHQPGCDHSYRPQGYVCSCGVDSAVNRMALDISAVLEKFGTPG